MEVIEIIFIGLGVLLLIASCFIKQKGSSSAEIDYDDLIQRLSRRELSQAETDEIRRVIDRIIVERTEKIIEETDDYLSKVANEKILSVNEFSEQIMEKLNVNHKEVVFLYNMLNEKEAEMKDTISRISDAKREAVFLMEEMAEKKKSFVTTSDQAPKGIEHVKRQMVEKQMTIAPLQQSKQEEKQAEQVSSDGVTITNNTKEILALHRQGKSVIEISKMLGLGQGEVRLVVDLYGL